MEFDIRKFDCMNMFDDEAFTRKCMPEGKLFNSQTAGGFHGRTNLRTEDEFPC